MSIDLLFADFDRLIQSAESVHRLRRFILDLAVRGKLAPQDPNDEPASELLKRIAAEKARLVKAGAIRKEKSLPEIAPDEIPFGAPQGWEWVRLASSTIIVQGFAFSSGDFATDPDAGYPLIKIGDIGTSTPKVFIKEPHDPAYLVNRGDILVGLSGSIKCAIWEGPTALLNQRIARIAPSSGDLLSAWLLFGVNVCIDKWKDETSKLTVQNVKARQLYESLIPLPPVAEQHRIVAKVNELMAVCKRLEAARAEQEATRDRLATASLARLNAPNPDPAMFQHDVAFSLNNLAPLTTRPNQIKVLRQTILNLAVHGKLVPQDPNDEPASELLKRVIAENEATFVKGRKRKFLIGLRSDDEVPKNIPATWTWSSIGQLASEMRYGTAKKCEHRIKGTPVLRIPNVSRGEVDLTNLKFGALTEEEKKTLLLRENDLLVVRSNGSLGIVGRAAIVNKAAESMSFAGYLVRIRFRQRYIHTRYIWLAMNSQHVRDLIEKPIRSTVGLKNVNSTELAAITIPLPPLAEQQRIVAKIDELMTLCDRMEASLAWGNDNRRQLIDALLHEALKPEEECEKLAG